MPTRSRITRRFAPLALVAAVLGALVAVVPAGAGGGPYDLTWPGGTVQQSAWSSVGVGVAVRLHDNVTIGSVGLKVALAAPRNLQVEVREVPTWPTVPADDTWVAATPRATGHALVGPADQGVDGFAFVTLDAPFTFTSGTVYDIRVTNLDSWALNEPLDWYYPLDTGRDRTTGFPAQGGAFEVLDGATGFASAGWPGSAYHYGDFALPRIRLIEAVGDDVPPVISLTAESDPHGVWYGRNETGGDGLGIAVTATDDGGSGLVGDPTCVVDDTPAATLPLNLGDGIHHVECTAIDKAGNRAQVRETFQVDQVAPTVSASVSPSPVPIGGIATVAPIAADTGGSELVSGDPTCDAVDTSSPGIGHVTCTARDGAGNSSTAEAEYAVVYPFNGFFSPVVMGATNTAKAGSSVPLKFSLGGDRGLDAVDAATVMPCIGGAASAAVGSLSYDPSTDRYDFVWKTDKAWKGSCRVVTLALDDGTANQATFNFS